MPSKIDITDVRNIMAHVKNGEIKSALDTAKRCAVTLGLWQQLDALSTHERTYRAMTEYMSDESDPKQRHSTLAHIKEELLRLSDLIRLNMDLQNPRPGHESDIYTAEVRTRSLHADPPLQQILAEIDLASSQENRYKLLDSLFTLILTTQHLSSSQNDTIANLLQDDTADEDAAAMILSALGLANLYYYDRAKMILLLSQSKDESGILLARRMVGIYLSLWRHPARIALDPEVESRIATLIDDPFSLAVMRHVAMAFLSGRDTQRINEKMQNDIIPELQRLQSDFMSRFPSQADMTDILDPEKNPEWEELIHNSKLGDSIKELSDMQAQGSDVMMLAFSNLKNFGFFHRPGNWLLPYSPNHPMLSSASERYPELLDTITQAADFLCDSDKYSLALAIEKMPQGHGAMMLDRLKEQFEQYREEKNSTLKLATEPTIYSHITQYIRSISRLASQFPRPGLRLPNPFIKAILPSQLPFIKNRMNEQSDLETVSEFLFSRGYYEEALPALYSLEHTNPDNPSILEKIGYALQQTSDTNAALIYYSRAEMLSTQPSQWLLRKLASLNRAQGRHIEAARYWQQLADTNPDDPKIAMQLANSLFDAGNIADALKYYYKVDYLRGSSPRTWRPIAWCEFSLGNYEKAQNYYDRLLMTGEDASDFLNAGHLALARNRLNNAIELYTRAAKHHPEGLNGILLQLKADTDILSANGLNTETQTLLADRLAYNLES